MRSRLWTMGVWMLLAGCGGGGAVAEETGPPQERETGGEPGDTSWTAGIVHVPGSQDRPVMQRKVRAARHDGFDRVVFGFGEELPGYHVEYVDRPVRHCASGEPVEVDGEGWLRVRLEPARAHTEEGEVTVEKRSQRPGLPVLRELVLVCDFEGQVEWVLGVGTPNRYRVLELSDPARIVVDVRHR